MKTKAPDRKRSIVVVTSGWVFVGAVEELDNGFLISDASCIRVWGTERGLGQLALSGATSATVLEPCGEVFVTKGHFMFSIPSESDL